MNGIEIPDDPQLFMDDWGSDLAGFADTFTLESSGGGAFAIRGKNLKTSIELEIERKDLSGDSSSGAFAPAGAKTQKITISLQIEKKNPQHLLGLIQKSQENNDDGSPVIFNISNDHCAARGIRQAYFEGTVSSADADGVQAWNVSFTMREYNSVPEKLEGREEQKEAEATGDGVTAVGSTDPEKVNAAAKGAK